MLKPSQYNHVFTFDGNKYAYNTLSTSLIQLDESGFSALTKSDVNKEPAITINLLKDEGFLVEQFCIESDQFRYYYDRTRFLATADRLNIIFIPTYNCNLRCPYCYEGLNKDRKKIDEKGIDSILRFIEKRIKECQSDSPIKVLDVQLYGGEPLLCKEEIKYFCKQVSSLAKDANTNVEYSMVSNLTLLDDDIVSLIKNFDISVQVSIDGNRTEHNKRRIWANGDGTFDLIITNLQKLNDAGLRDNVIIRLNTDLESIDELCSLFSLLTQYSADVYFGVLTTYKGCNDNYENCMESGMAEAVLAEKTDYLYKKLGLPIPQRFGKKGPCSLNCENKYMIDCNLDVYKCDLLINHKECRVGTISTNGDFQVEDNFYKQMAFSPFNNEKCVSCKLLPLCAGGCPATAYLNSGRNDGNLNLYECAFSEKKLEKVLSSYIENQ